MKDNFIFILISLLTLNTVMGDNPIYIPAVKISTPGSTPSNSTEPQNGELPVFLVLGFKKISIDSFIVFYVFTRITHYSGGILRLKARASSNNLRLLAEDTIDFECTPISDTANNGKTFNCSRENTEGYKEIIVDTESIEINNIKAESSPSANLTNNLNTNLNTDLTNLIENKDILEMQCTKKLQGTNNIYIEGTIDGAINENNPYLLVVNSDKYNHKVPCHFERIGQTSEYNLTLSPTTKIDADLHEQIGRINDQQSVILNFGSANGSRVVNDFLPGNKYVKKSSSGISTGGIVAIVIPCIAVLLAVAGLAFILGNKTKPPVQNIENTTIGINSSSEINNK